MSRDGEKKRGRERKRNIVCEERRKSPYTSAVVVIALLLVSIPGKNAGGLLFLSFFCFTKSLLVSQLRGVDRTEYVDVQLWCVWGGV